ncbi:calcium-binding protein [Microvirga sp. 0TCS3.31]
MSATSVGTETCFGQAATIVARSGESVMGGTSGPDVVVSYGADPILTGDGNDLVCVFGGARPDSEGYLFGIDTGPGDDRVDTRGTSAYIATGLGGGADQFEGGPGSDIVSSSGHDDRLRDIEQDFISTGGGADQVYTSGDSDNVVLGDGNDTVTLTGLTKPEAVLDGGSGANKLDMHLLDARRQSWTVDNRAGKLRGDATVRADWIGFTNFEIVAPGPVEFLGSGLDESLTVGPKVVPGTDGFARIHRWPVDARMGGGDDVVAFIGGSDDTQFDGGPGTDELRYTTWLRRLRNTPSEVVLDLAAGWLTDTEANWRRRWQARRFEDANVRNSSGRTHIRGTDGPNLLSAKRSSADTTIDGESGADVLVGGGGNDSLRGGKGRDSADGRPGGRDRCEAEVVISCEKVPESCEASPMARSGASKPALNLVRRAAV